MEQIAKCLSDKEYSVEYGIGYSTGNLGSFLFLHHYSLLVENEYYGSKAHLLLQQIIKQALTHNNSSTREVTEFGLVVLRLFEESYLPHNLAFINEKVDELLHTHLHSYLSQSNFDQFTGYLAIGSYFLKRGLSIDLANKSLQYIIDNLLDSSKITENGRYWLSNFQGSNRIVFNWSHGIASILLFLVNYINYGIVYRIAEVTVALQEGLQYVLYRKDRDHLYVSSDKLRKDLKDNTLNLCYGEIGIVYAVWQAATVLKDLTMSKNAFKQLLQLARRKNDSTCNVKDSSIIYGSSGNMLFFNHLFNYSQEAEFKQAAEYWSKQGKLLNYHSDYLLGFKNFYNQASNRAYFSLFEGISGYGLATIEYEIESIGLINIIGY